MGQYVLARKIVDAPFLLKAKGEHQKFEDWLSEIGRTAAGKRLQSLLAASPKAAELIAGLAEYSPHLWDLATADHERLLTLLQSDPEKHLAALLAATKTQIAAGADEAEVMRLLRQMKAEASLLVALADIGGVWQTEQVTRAMTELADCAICSAVHFLLDGLALSGQLTLTNPAHSEIGSGYFVLAMGKMGAFELNYSSDIDLIIFFDPNAPALASDIEPGPLFVRLTQNLVRLLQERTADGYVFRVDLRLRPDPASTPIAISTPAAIEYYERRGQNWERSAMIKARVCAGDLAAGNKFLSELSPFVWRKYMDYAALADIHAMKRQIHAYKGHGGIAVAGHNIKLGRGGIREIEFFVQTQQLIAGGRHPVLRERETLKTLHLLADGGWISAEAEQDLRPAYHFLRKVEHRLQMIADEQTHVLPSDPENLQRLVHFLGYADETVLAECLLSHLHKVQKHYSQLFEHVPASLSTRPLTFPKDSDDRETLDRLSAMGFRNPLEVSAFVRGWLVGPYPALKSEFARGQLAELAPLLLDQISRAESREAGLTSFDRFIAGLQPVGGGRLFSLLKQNPDLLALIALILGSAPRLADTLAHHPQVIDALIDPTFFGALPDSTTLVQELSRSLDQKTSYEDFLDRLRIFTQEQMFLVGARILSGTVSAQQAGEAFARIADAVIGTLHMEVEARFAESYGRIANQRTALLALGKLGGREMTASSDLDLILIYDFDEEHPESDGAAKLYGGQYFARLTQHLISALTVPTNYGALYQVDMRLRPSGRSGPVAIQIRAFENYQESEAWTWEHMALTRARVVSGTPGFGKDVEAVIRRALRRRRDGRIIKRDAFEMRQAIAREKGESDRWDMKYAAGGLIDVEFVAQALQLIHAADHPDILDTATARVLEKAARMQLLGPEDAEGLRAAARLYHDLSQMLRLSLPGKFEPQRAGAGLQGLLARAGDAPDFATLEASLIEMQGRVRESFLRVVGEKRQ